MPNSSTRLAREQGARRQVLVAMRLFETASQRKLAGLFAYIDTHVGWDMRLLRTQEELTAAMIDEAEADGLDGLVVSITYDPKLFRRIARMSCPVVVMDNDPVELRKRKSNVVVIRNDSDSIARAAVDAFSASGRFNSLAYVGTRFPNDWSDLRAKSFRKHAKGTNARVLMPTGTANDRAKLISFLRALDYPAAVLAANDMRAAEVIAAAAEAGIRIPEDLSIIGVDNDPYVCTQTSPSISSLEPDFFAEGEAAAKLLDRMMRARTPLGRRHVLVGMKRLVQRGSLAKLPPAQGVIRRAREYVHAHATEGITPRDVANHLRISRQLLDLRFREAGKGTVGECITAAKIAEVRRLLSKTDTPISQIAEMCGFANDNALKNLFKRTVGQTMRDYRREKRDGGGLVVSIQKNPHPVLSG